MLNDENYFKEQIRDNTTNNYYWSENWDEWFYVELAKKGFISTSYDTKDGLVLLPELQYEYSILDFYNLHISKKVQKLIKKDDAILSFNTSFTEVLQGFSKQHKYNWLKDEYVNLMKNIYKNNNNFENFELVSVELISKDNNKLIAGEIGYIIGKTYTSLSGFSSKENIYNNYGTLQLVLLAKHLQEKGFSFWNLGHPHMTYKQKLGAKTYSREAFLQRWEKEIKNDALYIY